MQIGILKETKNKEGRVAATPAMVADWVKEGHTVAIQKNAGINVGYKDADYIRSGAQILNAPKVLIQKSELIIKVKEPTLEEVDLMQEGQMIFCYLHLASMPALLKKILKRKITALGYETVELKDHSLPLLKPMSEIAGQLASLNGAFYLRADQGGRGVLLGGTETVEPASTVVLGGGTVGENAARVAAGMGSKVLVFDVSEDRLKVLKKKLPSIQTAISDLKAIEKAVKDCDLLIGAVLIPGAKAPKLVTQDTVEQMKGGAVIVDVAVDQGGCVETSVVTSHENPVVKRFSILHYGVPNMPGSVPITATEALTNVSHKYITALADLGLVGVQKKYPEMEGALNCFKGEISHKALKGIV